MINGLDLFSGIGGISLGLREWVRPRYYCEIDRYAQGVLLSRMSDGELPWAPIWDDVQTLRGELLEVQPDIIYGGFPCQDLSVAGAGRGLEGERSGLFHEVIRLTKELEPQWVFLENVPAIRTRGPREVIRAFTDIRYDCRWTCVSAAELGAPHLRKRWFLLAHSSIQGPQGLQPQPGQQEVTEPWSSSWWSTEPDVGRVVNGLSGRVDRLKALGNAVVPLQAKTAFERLMGICQDT